MRTALLSFVVVMLIGSAFCFQDVIVGKSVAEESVVEVNRQDRIDNIVENLELTGEPKEVYPVGPHMIVGNAVEWCIDNADKHSGWSLTGWSKMGLNENFNPWFLKIGIISGRIEGPEQIGYVEDANWRLFEEWQQRDSGRGIVAGIQISVLF